MNGKIAFVLFLLLIAFSLFAQDVETFETGDFSAYNWQLSGDADWFVTTTSPHGGTYCAQGGDIDDSQATSLSVTRDVSSASQISFYWKVDSENNYDYLHFYIDDTEISSICGSHDWELYQTTVSIGSHTFKWAYTKDSSVSSGEDTGWIDDITFPMSIVYDNDLAITSFSGAGMALAGSEAIFNCTVRNSGSQPQNAFTLNLLKADGTVLNSLQLTDEMQPNSSQDYELTWDIPSTEPPGIASIHSEVILTGDENLNNNTSGDVDISIISEGLNQINIGTGNVESNNVPIDFYYRSSISEVLYYPSELPPSGVLQSITYYYNFPEDLSNQSINIWAGETTMDGLDSQWISAPDLQQVFSGTLDFQTGNNGSVYIELDTPYEYMGGNLVILVERPMDTEYYSSSDHFYCTNVENYTNRCRNYYNDSTALDPQNLSNDSGDIRSFFPNTTLEFMIGGYGSLEGYVYDNENAALNNVLVEILNTNYSVHTNNDGYFSLGNINPGNYTVSASLSGYNPQSLDNILVVADSTTQIQFNLSPLATASILGHVVASDAPDSPLVGAHVELTGIMNLQAYTDDNGNFEFNPVYANNSYSITISYAGYESYSSSVDVLNNPVDMGTITLSEIAVPPGNVMAVQDESQNVATIAWSNSGGFNGEFRYDDGNIAGSIGSGTTPPHAAFGVKFTTHAVINEIRWYLTAEYAEHPIVKLYIFGLNSSTHLPNSDNLLFQSGAIENIDDEWNSYVLESPIEATMGFFIAVSTPNIFTGLGYDDGIDAPWEFVYDSQYATNDWTDPNGWATIETFGFYNNLMLRAYGSEISAESFDKSLESFNVYRFNVLDQNNPNSWTTVATGVTDSTYIDETYGALPIGNYRYAVTAVYTNNIESEATFSNVLIKEIVGNNPVEILPMATKIYGNYPNPFNPSTVIKFDVKMNETATLKIYNLKGQLVKSCDDLKAGKHSIVWNGKDMQNKSVPSGVYFYKLKTDSKVEIHKMMMLK